MNDKSPKIVEVSREKHNFNLNIFEGPLDVLLHLAKTSQIEITDISLDQLIDQYITYIESVQDQGINIASEYIEMAAELIRLKSKTLLPQSKLSELEEEIDGTFTREQLIQKLVEYKKYKDAALELEKLHELRPQTFYKSPSKMKEFRTENFNLSINIDKIRLAMQSILLMQNENVQKTKIIEIKELDVKAKIEHLKTLKSPKRFSQIISDLERMDRVAYFLGLLESIKLGFVQVIVEEEDILVNPGEYKDE